jgi:hypothetical protein
MYARLKIRPFEGDLFPPEATLALFSAIRDVRETSTPSGRFAQIAVDRGRCGERVNSTEAA